MIVLKPDDKALAKRIPAHEESVQAEAERGRVRLVLGTTHIIISQKQAHTLRLTLEKMKLDKTKE